MLKMILEMSALSAVMGIMCGAAFGLSACAFYSYPWGQNEIKYKK